MSTLIIYEDEKTRCAEEGAPIQGAAETRETRGEQGANQGAHPGRGAEPLSQKGAGGNDHPADLPKGRHRRGHTVQLFPDEGGPGPLLFSKRDGLLDRVVPVRHTVAKSSPPREAVRHHSSA